MFIGEIEPRIDLFDDPQTSLSPECIQQRLEVTKEHASICSPWFGSEKNYVQATNYSKDRWFAMCSFFMWSAGAGIKAARKVLKDCSLLPSPSASPTLTMFATHFIAFATMAAVAFVGVRAETHTINFVNKYVNPDFFLGSY